MSVLATLLIEIPGFKVYLETTSFCCFVTMIYVSTTLHCSVNPQTWCKSSFIQKTVLINGCCSHHVCLHKVYKSYINLSLHLFALIKCAVHWLEPPTTSASSIVNRVGTRPRQTRTRVTIVCCGSRYGSCNMENSTHVFVWVCVHAWVREYVCLLFHIYKTGTMLFCDVREIIFFNQPSSSRLVKVP